MTNKSTLDILNVCNNLKDKKGDKNERLINATTCCMKGNKIN